MRMCQICIAVNGPTGHTEPQNNMQVTGALVRVI